ncbi:amidohydrolase [Microvirga thermotolerans]|uniref:Amidohydrolase n=1 Tax=Microvirga thermotolerans TaxID=2651334 RepID=A0A5P9JVT7_9HYPH|nr:amidohydrolase [Microvirga thermotolerans]QFU16319.1 amidohydrolase [Microvirga thermotolerans]
MFLTNQDVVELTEWRRGLHRMPDVSGEEARTAETVAALLASTGADRIVTGLGGHGVAGIYEGREPGPTVMVRAELDGLPIQEISDVPHRSAVPGKAHLCGHDGHMAILAALARGLGRRRPQRGRAVLMFQPAEEDGSGAAAVVEDPKFREIAPDFAFALHNLPGMPLGKAALIEGPVSCASRGMRIALMGKTAHASMPEFGLSPADAVAKLMPALTGLGRGGPLDEGFAMVTVTHARVGEPAFGIAPGYAEIWATLRTLTDAGMEGLVSRAEALAADVAREQGLGLEIAYRDVFRHCENAPEAVAHLRRALDAEAVPWDRGDLPMRPSEDFGRFGDGACAAMFFLGAGEKHPSLHNPDYDFPDDLIAIGARVFMRTLRDMLG